jgi:hypothetical protein
MQTQSANARLSLFAGADDLAAGMLGIRNIRHRGSFLTLGRTAPTGFDGSVLVARLFSLISENWRVCLAAANHLPSRENWRWYEPKCDISSRNTSPEVTLERAVVAVARQQGRTDWSNQVPIASGLIAGAGDRRRAIDLVRQRGAGSFDFIELKIASDNPIYAALEILQYGLVWLLSRQHRHHLGYAGKTLIEAGSIRLSVLAPREYYRGTDLSWLSGGLSDGLNAVGRSRGVSLSFGFEAFPEWFRWPGVAALETLSAVDSRSAW